MKSSCFEVTIENKVAHFQLNRPEKRNALIREFWLELPAAIREIDRQSQARVIVISSTGPHFTGGIDISMFVEPPPTDEEQIRNKRLTHGAAFYADVQAMQDTFSAIEQARIPVLAAIQGGCIGGGVDFVTACCLRYATKDAFFTIFETNIGMTADVGTFPRICRLIPEGIVRELAYTGRNMSADEALSCGLVNRVFDDHPQLIQGVMEVAAEIAKKAPLAISGCKRIITYSRDHSTADSLDYIRLWNASHLQFDEVAEAMQARTQKRDASFVDLPKMRGVIGSTEPN
jgi:enoyl-CoA hydratase